MTDNVFHVLPIKPLANKDGLPTTPHKMATDTKLSVSKPSILLCLCVVTNSTAHAYKRLLNMRHQSQNIFCGIFIGIPQHHKGYLFYVPSTQKIFCSHDVVFKEKIIVH